MTVDRQMFIQYVIAILAYCSIAQWLFTVCMSGHLAIHSRSPGPTDYSHITTVHNFINILNSTVHIDD